MDRNRDARRTAMATTNGLSRRRHRSSSLRDSPEDDGPVELQETSRLRDRKKDRDRDRDRERERDRDRDRDRDRLSRSKRRRGERLMHGSNRGEDGGDDTSEESVNDEDEDEDDDGGDGGGGSIRMLPPNPLTTSISSSLNHRKSFSPVHTLNNNKHFRPLTALKGTDEMIGVSVPRKARSASTKRSHEWPSSCGVVGGDQIHRQASTSPVRPSISAMAAPAPSSPSSSHASAVRKKLKPNGPKLRPPKMSSTKTTSSAQDEIEIEIAEVLYGMMRQPHVPSKQEVVATDSIKFESREANKSTSDAKSRVSSPISNSPCALPQPASAAAFPQNSSSSVTSMSAVAAPKRKRPRPVKYDDENLSSFTVQNSPISSTAKAVADQPAKVESSSPNLEKIPGSVADNGGFPYDLSNSHTVQAPPEAQPEPIRPESKVASDSRPANDESESQYVKASKEEPQSPKKESTGLRLDDNRQALTVTRTNSTVPVIENQREEKYQFDLMALPERDGEVDFISVDPKPAVIDAETEIKPPMNREEDKVVKIGKEETANVETEKSKSVVAEESAAAATDFKKPINGNKERSIDLQLDLEKTDKDSGTAGFSASKVHQNVVKQQQQQQNTEKSVQSSSVPLPMSVAGWPGAIPPMGYMAPLQGVVSMDGSTVSSAAIQPPHLLFNQPRPKRCATHCYIARNIYYHQQMSRMNPFWPVAPGSGGSLYGAKHCNPNVLPPELHGNIPGRGVNSAPDKGQGLAMFPGQTGKDKSSQSANLVDAQRKQLLLQQALPPGAPSNILHGPAFIFPMSQQQAVAAASGRPGSVKSPNAGGAVSSSAPNNASISATATAAAAPAMSFNYPNMAANEPQYLAILQNNAYPFPMPAHVGAQTAYRGPHGQPMPYFNGSFYSSTMLHPSHLQQPQQQPPSQSQQSQQGHQNTTISSGSSSSQKHLQNQQQRPHPGVANGGSGSLQGFAASKNQSSQALQLQQQQQQQQQKQQQSTHVLRQHESEMGGEDSPSTADSRVSRANMNIYSQNFAMPMHPPNFALLTPPSIGSASGATGASGAEKKQQQQQQQGSKAGVDASQAFALSFAPINGATAASGIDLQSMNHAILQSFPDVTRHQFMAAAAVAQAAQQKKSYRVTEEGKTGGGDPSNVEEERKAMSGKASSTVGHSIAFSRPDLTDAPGSTIAGNNVIDSSARTHNLSSTPVRVSNSVMPAAVSNVNAPTPQQQLQQMQQQMRNQQQQMIQLQKQQFSAAARSKTPATSNGSVYSDHLPSTSSMAAKFPNALSSFPQNLVQSSSSPAQSQSQWKNSSRTTTSQLPSSSLASSTSSTHKNLPQKHGRTQQSHTQISFAANTKSSSPSQGLQPASSNQSPSPPVMVGSPTTTTSSMSKSAGGSPRTTTSTSTGNKAGQPTSLSSQQTKNSPSGPTQKSSPVGGRNVPSILGNTGTKPQLQHQHQQHQQHQQQQHQHQQHQLQQPQQQLSKQSIQQAQLFFSNAYMQTQASHSNNATSASPASGYYPIPRRRPDQQQQQQSQGSSGTSSSGMLSLCPVTHSNTSTNDPAKAAAAAAANNMKGGGLSSQAIMHAQFAAAQSSGPHQLVPAGFPYVHAVPTAVQVKPAEQKKQPAGE